MVTDPFLTDDMTEQLHFSARKVGRRFRNTPVTDLYQEGMVWILSHRNRVDSWMNDEENPKRGWARYTRAIEHAMERMARAEKASRAGYDVDDEEFYARAMVELVLPALWNDGYRVDGPSREKRDPTTGGHDASEGNTWAAMVLDVERAYNNADLSHYEVGLLRSRYHGDGMSYAELGRAYGCAQSTAEVHTKRALRRIQNELGGSKPQACEPGCECGGPGSRRALSNATARSITEHDYED